MPSSNIGFHVFVPADPYDEPTSLWMGLKNPEIHVSICNYAQILID